MKELSEEIALRNNLELLKDSVKRLLVIIANHEKRIKELERQKQEVEEHNAS